MTKPSLLCLTACLLFAFVGPTAAQPEPTPTRAAIDRCRDFCSELYGPSGNQREQCDIGCLESDACSEQCKKKFPENKPQLHQCVRSCMKRSSARAL